MRTKFNKSKGGKAAAEQTVKNIRRATRKLYGAEEKIRIVLEGLRGESSIVIGTVIDKSGWDAGFGIIVAACVLSIFLLAMTWKAEKRSLLSPMPEEVV